MAFYTQSIPKEVLEKFRQYIEQAQNILLVSHTNPDGDALGSSLGLWHYLNLRGKTTNVIVPNRFPGFLKWLPGLDRIVIYEQDERKCAQLFKEADLVICLDFNAFHRVERLEKYLVGFRKPVLLIDHHLEPDVTFDSSISYTDSSSTSELVFDLIEGLGDKELINLDIAKCLYVGIMTDTGSFSYSCKHSRPFNITGFLVEKGLDVQSVNVLVYSTQSEDRLRLLGHLLSKRMVVMSEYNTAYIWLSLSDQEKFNYRPGDAEGFVNYALTIEGIKLAAFFTEKKDVVRISLRSKGDFSVNDMARRHFEGGGHRNAAGGNSFLSLRGTILRFRKIVEVYEKFLSNSI